MEDPYSHDEDAELPASFTALAEEFPVYQSEDRKAVAWNLRPGDAVVDGIDHVFHWQGLYFEIDAQGDPLHTTWREQLGNVAFYEKHQWVRAFCKSRSEPGDRVFYSPGKARRWDADVLGPDCEKDTQAENLLMKRGSKWTHYEVMDVPSDDMRRTFSNSAWKRMEEEEIEIDVKELILEKRLSSRITYACFDVPRADSAATASTIFSENVTEAAWTSGSTTIRHRAPSDGETQGRHLDRIPSSFMPVRWVPQLARLDFFRALSGTPAAVVSGSCLAGPSSRWGSPYSKKIARTVAQRFAKKAKANGITVMACASMRAHHDAASADFDFTEGFIEEDGCLSVNFKGQNPHQLHGCAWSIRHGVTYIFEEEDSDFSNHLKEAALMACACNPKSCVILANGGPTVSVNMSRFLVLTHRCRVFTVCGMHSALGTSGATGSFLVKEDQLVNSIAGLEDYSPFFAELGLPRTQEDIVKKLADRPVLLMKFTDPGCEAVEYYVRVEDPNKTQFPGILEGNESQIEAYADGVAEVAAKFCQW